MLRLMLRMSLICVAAALPLLAGCRSSDEGGDAEIVATTTQVADIARNVAGRRGRGPRHPHSERRPPRLRAAPSDAAAIAGAEVVITSGGEADEWVDELIESSGTDAQVIDLLDVVPIVRSEGGDVDPHWWQDPRNAVAATEAIRDELSRGRPRRARGIRGQRRRLHRRDPQRRPLVAGCMRFLPDSARKLVTSHDSLGYLADRYDIEVVGAAVPALSTQAQPSSGETADLVDLIQESRVQAVFGEAGLEDELVKRDRGRGRRRRRRAALRRLPGRGRIGGRHLPRRSHRERRRSCRGALGWRSRRCVPGGSVMHGPKASAEWAEVAEAQLRDHGHKASAPRCRGAGVDRAPELRRHGPGHRRRPQATKEEGGHRDRLPHARGARGPEARAASRPRQRVGSLRARAAGRATITTTSSAGTAARRSRSKTPRSSGRSRRSASGSPRALTSTT